MKQVWRVSKISQTIHLKCRSVEAKTGHGRIFPNATWGSMRWEQKLKSHSKFSHAQCFFCLCVSLDCNQLGNSLHIAHRGVLQGSITFTSLLTVCSSFVKTPSSSVLPDIPHISCQVVFGQPFLSSLSFLQLFVTAPLAASLSEHRINIFPGF